MIVIEAFSLDRKIRYCNLIHIFVLIKFNNRGFSQESPNQP